MIKETVTISKKEYAKLTHDSLLLECLRSAGVDRFHALEKENEALQGQIRWLNSIVHQNIKTQNEPKLSPEAVEHIVDLSVRPSKDFSMPPEATEWFVEMITAPPEATKVFGEAVSRYNAIYGDTKR